MKFDESGPKISTELLDEFEKKHRIALPEDYKNFLVSINGGIPYPASFKGETGIEISIPHLFSLKAKSRFNDLDVRCKSSYWEGSYEQGIIQIGYDLGNQEIMLETKGPNRGNVYLLVNAESHLMARSFSEFLERLEKQVGVERNAYDELMDRINSDNP